MYVVRSGGGYVLDYKEGYMPYMTSSRENAMRMGLSVAKIIADYMDKKNLEAIIEYERK